MKLKEGVWADMSGRTENAKKLTRDKIKDHHMGGRTQALVCEGPRLERAGLKPCLNPTRMLLRSPRNAERIWMFMYPS